jgi:hypothetical protein
MIHTVPTLLTEQEVSDLTGIRVASLQTARSRGDGIQLPYVQLSARRVRYRADDVAAFIEARTIRPGSPPPQRD